MKFDLDACAELLALDDREIRDRLEVNGGETHCGVRYEGLAGLCQYYNPQVFPARVYVRGGRVEVVYVPPGAALQDLSPVALEARAGTPSALLRSRGGKEYVHHAHPEHGFAYSSDGDEILFVEVFEPRSLDAYLADIYRDPGPFIR